MTSMIATCSLDKKNLDVSCIIIKYLSSSTLALWYRCMHHFFFHHKIAFKIVKVHLTPIFFSAEMKLRNLPIFLVSDIFKGFKN